MTNFKVWRILLAGLLAALAILPGCQRQAPPTTLRFSGTIEATQVTLSAEVSGRVVELAAGEGDAVREGQLLARLDDAALMAAVKQAQAALAAAQANLAQVKSGPRAEEVAAAQAAVTQAQAERDGAARAYKDALAILANPQAINAQVDAAQTAVAVAEGRVAAAQTKLAEARWWREFYDDDKGQHRTLDNKIGIAQADLEAAQAQLDGARAQLAALQSMRDWPVTLRAQANNTMSTYSLTVASVAVAQAALADVKAGAAPEEVAIAEAKVRQAQAQLDLAQAQAKRARISSPLSGIVTARPIRAGEIAQPGAAIVTITDLDDVRLVVCVSQPNLPRVQVGMPVQVRVDAYPESTFSGEVMSIARRAQFASRDTQGREERAKMVFAVKIRLPNADHRLKAGMPGDVVIDLGH